MVATAQNARSLKHSTSYLTYFINLYKQPQQLEDEKRHIRYFQVILQQGTLICLYALGIATI